MVYVGIYRNTIILRFRFVNTETWNANIKTSTNREIELKIQHSMLGFTGSGMRLVRTQEHSTVKWPQEIRNDFVQGVIWHFRTQFEQGDLSN